MSVSHLLEYDFLPYQVINIYIYLHTQSESVLKVLPSDMKKGDIRVHEQEPIDSTFCAYASNCRN